MKAGYLNMLWTTDTAITLANGCHSSVAALLPSAKSDTALITTHSMPRSRATAHRPKFRKKDDNVHAEVSGTMFMQK